HLRCPATARSDETTQPSRLPCHRSKRLREMHNPRSSPLTATRSPCARRRCSRQRSMRERRTRAENPLLSRSRPRLRAAAACEKRSTVETWLTLEHARLVYDTLGCSISEHNLHAIPVKCPRMPSLGQCSAESI